ncbi:protein kinase, putative [Ichthyophthirius multifiliis]|uniref:Protein kinase, putative n=1 Tax=Ichthyophthirius multifiliis TaxID=5932 RepID=G0QYI9_ICHMU|nr:protein kinase, putative [Ichthyophthirius multifiliis]EGR29714.1 protein kinase, putative [Ichthyophthirius multifiliis]|eukprot:XP_004030950.1 protein kinase, putative [Ichthyophthirius multifiliis]
MQNCNNQFQYDKKLIPRRYLTFPNEGLQNDFNDNIESDLIMKVNDTLINSQKQTEYVIHDLLGKGTFGQVVRCSILGQNDVVAIKVIKNKPAYFQQAKSEILLLRLLNKQENEILKQIQNVNESYKIVKLIDFFIFKYHFCLVFEILDLSLYDNIKNNKFQGFSFEQISQWGRQILQGMIITESKQIIHCDLKPENIMIKKNNELKIIDFGSACQEENRIYTYIQSRFYRAPEILLGIKYTISIDMWSLGCILAELFLGLPIFPGNCEYDQIKRIVDVLGYFKKKNSSQQYN